MKYKLLFTVALVSIAQFLTVSVRAQEDITNAYLQQRSLIDEEGAHILFAERINSNISEVFSNPGDWAQIVIECNSEYNLSFSLNKEILLDLSKDTPNKDKLDKKMSQRDGIIAKTEKGKQDTKYYLWIRGGKKNSRRMITIYASCKEFNGAISINVFDLVPKSSVSYRVFDTASENDGTAFQRHYTKANSYMRKCNYQAAKLEYSLASNCRDGSNEVKEYVGQRISDCDSIMLLSNEGETLMEQERFVEAADVFRRALRYNGSDSYLFARYYYCNRKNNNHDILYYLRAGDKFAEKDYDAAAILYQAVADMGGEHAEEAKKRIEDCKLLSRREKNTERYIGAEIGFLSPEMYGFTRGAYNHKVDYYFTAKINRNLFHLIRKEYKMDEHAMLEIIPIGLTVPLIKPHGQFFKGIWLNMGLGVLGSSRNECDNQELQSSDLEDLDNLSPHIDYSVIAEGGIMLKIWRIGLRTNYHYSVPVSKEALDYVNKDYFSLGVGFFF